ncbi:transcription termination factor 5, mitochondrial isoform X2 [Phymastichus coffea]|uniref:transcription termination factor 5, mitochondrial isoform X2 n=1 Tax=Phymastichus coffea TaxID=108790 RepID=UPI00273C192C|nr:transcription termination factor 5, mitochondrial isoform X2 [Phymastichus coffea]
MFFKLIKSNKCTSFCKLSSQTLSENIHTCQISAANNVPFYNDYYHSNFATKLGRRLRKVSVIINQKHINSVIAVLKKHNIDTRHLHNRSRIFHHTPWAIEQKIMLLEELGTANITTKTLMLFRRRLLLPVNIFKMYIPLPQDKPLADNLFAYINNCNTDPEEIGIHENQTTKLYLHLCLVHYIKDKLELNPLQVNILKNRKNNAFLVQSFRLFSRNLEFLRDDVKLSKKKIIRHYFTLLSRHPDQLQIIYNLVTEIANERAQLIAIQYPPMFEHNLDDFKIIVSFLKKHVNHPEKIATCHMIRIFQITSDELKRRFDYFSKNYYTQNLVNHPKFINLISLYHSVLPRLRYLEEQNLQYATIQSLTTYKANYHEDLVTFKSLNVNDIKSFFHVNFGNDACEALQIFKKHVYYKFVTLYSMRKSLDYLKGIFPGDMIKEYSYAILYNEMDLRAAYKEVMKNPDYCKLPPNQLLTLCLYKIELNSHFTGDPVLAPGKYSELLKDNVYQVEQISKVKE